jgi:hypothetical protein
LLRGVHGCAPCRFHLRPILVSLCGRR